MNDPQTYHLEGFDLFDPTSWVPVYGLWCGPNWSAGERGPTRPSSLYVQAPVYSEGRHESVVDLLCKHHDMAYIKAEHGGNEAVDKAMADLRLLQGLNEAAGTMTLKGETTYGAMMAATFAYKLIAVDLPQVGFHALSSVISEVLHLGKKFFEQLDGLAYKDPFGNHMSASTDKGIDKYGVEFTVQSVTYVNVDGSSRTVTHYLDKNHEVFSSFNPSESTTGAVLAVSKSGQVKLRNGAGTSEILLHSTEDGIADPTPVVPDTPTHGWHVGAGKPSRSAQLVRLAHEPSPTAHAARTPTDEAVPTKSNASDAGDTAALHHTTPRSADADQSPDHPPESSHAAGKEHVASTPPPTATSHPPEHLDQPISSDTGGRFPLPFEMQNEFWRWNNGVRWAFPPGYFDQRTHDWIYSGPDEWRYLVGNGGVYQVSPGGPRDFVHPVVMDLNGDGKFSLLTLATTPTEAGPLFDMNGDGVRDVTAWVAPEDGLLVIDLDAFGNLDGDGIIDSTREIAYSQWKSAAQWHHDMGLRALTGAESDLAALRSLFDSNHDNVLDIHDEAWHAFKVWQDRNQNGQVDSGELETLQTRGIESIELVPDEHGASHYSDGSFVSGTAQAHSHDGASMLIGDLSLSYLHGAVSGPLG